MKTRKINNIFAKYILLLALVAFISSCTEVIEFELEESAPQLVVEATVPESEYAEVVLSTTVNVNDDKAGSEVKGAMVILEDEKGNSETLSEVAPGRYRSSKIKGVPNASYKLRIEAENHVQDIISQDKMPVPVPISRLRVRESNIPDVNGLPVPEWEVVVEYNDPANERNYYRFVEYVNGKVSAHYVENDNFNNGTKSKSFLTSCDRKLVPGDTVTVEMQSISKAVYDYFYGFSLLNNVSQGSSVVNPVTNVSGVKLGYFSAHTVSRKSIVVK